MTVKPIAACLFVAALAVSSTASAHAVWLDEGGAGAVRVFLGEPAEVQPAGGDPEFPKLTAPVVFAGSTAAASPLARQTNHIRATVATSGDVRLRDDNVFAPWAVRNGAAYEGAIYYARLGRSEPTSHLDLELAPVAPNSDTLVVTFKGKPVPDASVTVIDPELWTKSVKADADGRIQVPGGKPGRYLLEVTHGEDGPRRLRDREVAKVWHTSTLTFTR